MFAIENLKNKLIVDDINNLKEIGLLRLNCCVVICEDENSFNAIRKSLPYVAELKPNRFISIGRFASELEDCMDSIIEGGDDSMLDIATIAILDDDEEDGPESIWDYFGCFSGYEGDNVIAFDKSSMAGIAMLGKVLSCIPT